MDEPVTVIRVGAEGGDWTLVARPGGAGPWEYQTRLNDQTLPLFHEGSAIKRDSEWLIDWPAAMRAFGRYPWEQLYPVAVDSRFAGLVWDALLRRSSVFWTAPGEYRKDKWARLCGRGERGEAELEAGPDALPIVLRARDDSPITSMDAWPRPKQAYQWKPGRSAQELARIWLEPTPGNVPPTLRKLLDSDPSTRGIRLLDAWPEFVTALPQRGEGRNHDLRILGDQYGAPVTICVEAKADEPFGDATIQEYVASAKSKVRSDGTPQPTGVPARVDALLRLLVPADAEPWAPEYLSLRYQLLTGLAGTCLQAGLDGAKTAIFVVHEFRGAGLDESKLAQNAEDLASAVATLGLHSLRPEFLAGPIRAKNRLETKADDLDLYVGKIVSTLVDP